MTKTRGSKGELSPEQQAICSLKIDGIDYYFETPVLNFIIALANERDFYKEKFTELSDKKTEKP